MDTLGIVPITQKFLQNNYLMALGFREGFIFGRVIKRRICMYKPWSLIDANGNAVDIAEYSYAAQGCLRFRDPRNTQNDILYLDSETDQGYPWILHGAIGIKPNVIQCYLRYPEAQDIPGKFPNIDPIVPSAGDRTGYFNGLVSPYEYPSDFCEIVLPPKIHIGAEYYNREYEVDGLVAHRPTMNLLFSVYWFDALNKDRHARLISKIAKREVPAAFFSIGLGDVPLTYGGDYERHWGVTALSLDEAINLGGRQ